MQAFHGDAAEKTKLVESIRPRWVAGQLLPATILKFDTENKLFSLGGALANTQDIDVFVATTGIPHELAMLCEALVSAGVELVTEAGPPPTFALKGADKVLSFGVEWLDAIRPGADLSDVVPQFMARFMECVLSPAFPLASHIEPQAREIAGRILGYWRQELAGETVDGKTWRAVRKAATEASATLTDPWCFFFGDLLEALAWPVRGLGGEFVALYRSFAIVWTGIVQRPYLDPEDQENQVLSSKGWRLVAKVSKESGDDEEAVQRALDAAPGEKRALMSVGDPVVRARLRAGKLCAQEVTGDVVREQMDELLELIKSV